MQLESYAHGTRIKHPNKPLSPEAKLELAKMKPSRQAVRMGLRAAAYFHVHKAYDLPRRIARAIARTLAARKYREDRAPKEKEAGS